MRFAVLLAVRGTFELPRRGILPAAAGLLSFAAGLESPPALPLEQQVARLLAQVPVLVGLTSAREHRA